MKEKIKLVFNKDQKQTNPKIKQTSNTGRPLRITNRIPKGDQQDTGEDNQDTKEDKPFKVKQEIVDGYRHEC